MFFLDVHTVEGSDLRFPSPVCAMRFSVCPLCPYSPCHVDSGGHGLVSSARASPGGLLSAVPCDVCGFVGASRSDRETGRGWGLTPVPFGVFYMISHPVPFVNTNFHFFEICTLLEKCRNYPGCTLCPISRE